MRTFFEDLGQRIAETAEKVTNKAEDAVEVTRIKNQIRNLEHANKEDLIELGKKIYAQYKTGEGISAEYADLCEAVENRQASIQKYEKQLSVVKGDMVCPKCGKYVSKDKDRNFCPYCGENLLKEMQDLAEEVKDKAEDAMEVAKDKAEDAMDKAKDKAEDAVDKVKDKISDAKEKTSDFVQDVREKTAEKVSDVLDN